MSGAAARPRVIVVEDEALVAVMLEDLLGDFGCEVVGSFAMLDDALDWLEGQAIPPDGALLDVNLGGELVYPLADALAARGAPFVFASGYARSKLDPRFAHVPLLEKPIDDRRLRAVAESFAGRSDG